MSKEHKYAQVLRWIADGEQVQVCSISAEWVNPTQSELFEAIITEYYPPDRFRLAPRTIRVNGVEVSAPEMVNLQCGTLYFIPALHECEDCNMWYECEWRGSEFDSVMLSRGLVYLRKEDAIARAKAMLLTQE